MIHPTLTRFFQTFLLLLTSSVTTVQGFTLENTLWERASPPGIDPHLLYAIALVESRTLSQPGIAVPRPFVIRVGNEVSNFDNYEDAARALKRLVQSTNNLKQIDVGMMQINLGWHQHRVERYTDLLIPAIGIHVASEILGEAMASTENTVIGIGRYHSYTPQRAKRYGRDVVHIACNIGWKNHACEDILGREFAYANQSHGGDFE